MPAPIFGTTYLEHNPATSAENPVIAEDTSKYDPAFTTAWNNTKYLIFDEWNGDNSLIAAFAALAYRYKSGTGVYTPSIGSITPTTTVHNVAFTLTVNGTNLDSSAQVQLIGGTPSKTTVLPNATSTPTQLTASVPAGAIATAGTYTVALINIGGVISTTTNLTVT